jgi:hypothetical protein
MWTILVAVCLAYGVAATVVEAKTKPKKDSAPPVAPVPAPGGVNKDDPTMPPPLPGGNKPKPVAGGTLYAKPETSKTDAPLTLHFPAPGNRAVIAFARKTRKDRFSREGITDEQRERMKPYRAEIQDGGRAARFPALPPDFYDLVVLDQDTGMLYEGIDLLPDDNADLAPGALFDEVKKTLAPAKDRIGGFDAFFDQKSCERLETDGLRAAVLVQQMRLGKTLAESGAELKGCVHSLDVVWLVKGSAEGAWQIMSRQQLYREELPLRDFFRWQFRQELCGVRMGAEAKDTGVILTSDIKEKK